MKIADVWRRQGISNATFHARSAKYGCIDVSGRWSLEALKDENGKLKRRLAGSMQSSIALKDILGRKW